MTKSDLQLRRLTICGTIMAALTSCASPAALPTQLPQSSSNGTVTSSGVIVAARSIDLQTGQNGAKLGVDDVMAALDEPLPGLSFEAQELIIKRSDGNPTSIVTRSEPTVAPSGEEGLITGFSVGDHVTIVKNAQTVLLHSN